MVKQANKATRKTRTKEQIAKDKSKAEKLKLQKEKAKEKVQKDKAKLKKLKDIEQVRKAKETLKKNKGKNLNKASDKILKRKVVKDDGIVEATINLEEAPRLLTCPVTGMEFVFVKGGCFQMGIQMGDTFSDDFPEEKPVHEVCVSDFYIGKYEVTQGQWKKVMGSNPSEFETCGENCPVESVSWDDIQKFLSKLNSQSGKNYRLPTEAEWEYAARSGGKNEKWAGTSSESELDDYGWYEENSGDGTHPVGQKKPNGLGIYDMAGNVFELCSDWYGADYYGESPRDNPKGPSSGSKRVGRGGSFYNFAKYARTSFRYSFSPVIFAGDLGFRLVAPRGQ